MTTAEADARSCQASAERWRQEAVNLRVLADGAHLSPEQRAMLLREADAADRQAKWWISGRDEYASLDKGARS